MTVSIYQADAFTHTLFGGNPAAIIPLQTWLNDEMMQSIAAENNLAETAFFVPTTAGFFIRWFTPALEIDLCGHATLAAAHIIFTELNHSTDIIYFETKLAGLLTVTRNKDKYTLDFPARMPVKADAPPGLLSAMGDVMPIEILKSRDYMLVYAHENQVAELKPDFAALSKIDMIGVIATSKGTHSDFVSRFFAPAAGINEDPVTGSSHCNLIPYWAEKLGKNDLHAFQISARKGELWCEYAGDRVRMTGHAITYLRGNIFI